MEIYLYNDNSTVLTPHHRPFTFQCEIVNNPEDADKILIKPVDYMRFLTDGKMRSYWEKGVVYANDDNPNYLLREDKIKKLLAQPLVKKNILDKYNATTIPLVMTDHLKIHLDKDFIEQCRNQEKVYDYYFVGQFYGKRDVLLGFNEGKSIIKKTGSIYGLNDEAKLQSIKDFLMELGKSRFGFAPRGVGSNSFRLYECLMVGTVPIATDVIQYPDEDIVDWDSFTIRGSLDNLNGLIEKTRQIDYNKYRNKGIEYWEKYGKMDVLFEKIKSEL